MRRPGRKKGSKPYFRRPVIATKPIDAKEKTLLLERFVELHRKHAAKVWAQPHLLPRPEELQMLRATLSKCLAKEKVGPYLEKLRTGEIFVGGNPRVSITVVPDGFLTESECHALESNIELNSGGTLTRKVYSFSQFKDWVLRTANFVELKKWLDLQQ